MTTRRFLGQSPDYHHSILPNPFRRFLRILVLSYGRDLLRQHRQVIKVYM
jgi:hypothetical protein